MFPTASGEKFFAHFETLGCRLNQIESEGAADAFSDAGFQIDMNPIAAKDDARHDVCVCVLNTCTVTTKAEQKARRVIRLLLKKFPNALLIVTGCYAQLSPKEISQMDERICVLPGLAKSALRGIPQKIKALKTGPKRASGILKSDLFSEPTQKDNVALSPFELLPKTFFSHSRASLKIQDGCDNACSYCAIHLARGKSVSLDAALVLERISALENQGHGEVVLTGVNVAQYECSFEGKTLNIADLLELILARTKKIALRFSSIYPETASEKFCELIKDERVRPHFHLSVQSGSDAILKRMNRRYTSQDVRESCQRLRDAKGNPFLACDIIAGFPGETEEDFFETMDMLKACGFANVHAFAFSPRRGTPASSFAPKIPERIKDERVKILNEFSASQKIKYIEAFAGSVRPAIAENVHNAQSSFTTTPAGKKVAHALTDNFIHTEILIDEKDTHPKEGEIVRVKILCAQKGKIISGQEWEALGEFL